MSWWRRVADSAVPDETAAAAALDRVARHVVSTLPPRTPWTEDELADEEAWLTPWPEREKDDVAVTDLHAVLDDLAQIARARYEPALPVLLALWEHCPARAVALAAGRALLTIATAPAHDALQTRLGDPDWLAARVAVTSLLVDSRAEDSVFVELCDRALASDARARRILRAAFQCSTDELREPRDPMLRSRLGRPGLIEAAARLRRCGPCEADACALLNECPREQVWAALERHPLPAAQAASDPARLESYRANSAPAWETLVELGPVDGALRAQALELAMQTMAPIARNADRITERLAALGWPLRAEARTTLRPVPARPNHFTREVPPRLADDERARGDVDAQIALIEGWAGARVPVAIEAFLRVVGGIDWSPPLDDELPDWASELDIDRIDPLCIYDLESTWDSVEEWVTRRDGAKHLELAGRLRIWISPDRYHKMGCSGGAAYEVDVDGSVDPLVRHAPERLRFVAYLRHALRWGGLPGIAHAKYRSPELERVVSALTAGLEPF